MYKNILWGAGIVSLFTVTSCDKIEDFKDTNTNPNQTTTPIPSALLTNVESNMGAQLGFDAGGINTGSGLYAQYYSETQYTEVSRYNKPYYNYDTYYGGSIEDLQNIINYNSDPNTADAAAVFGSNNNQIAIARILKAHYIKFLTDAVGDLPYFDAFNGSTGVITVKYDAQQAIYTDLLKELKEAVEQFDNGTAVQGDIIFNGDVSKWKKYANSLRLLLALNMRKVDAGTAQSEFVDALNNSAGVIEDNSDNVTINYPGGVFPQPIFNYYVLTQRLDFAVSETMTDQLSSTNDPRSAVFASSTKGFPYGLTRDDAVAFAGANADWARILAGTNTPTNSSWTLLSAANVYLARAEAAQLGWTSEVIWDGSGNGVYEKGVAASFAQWGVDGSVYVSSLTDPSEEDIATQEWLAFYPNGLEGWDIYRRTGFPTLTPAPGTTSGIPRRATYGVRDYSYNSSNVGAAAANYTVNGQPDSQWGRIWWDKQ
jgi:Starch-binding associating with outer membrane